MNKRSTRSSIKVRLRASVVGLAILVLGPISALAVDRNAASSKPKLATVEEMIDARTDVWGDAAMREPNGASYEFFKDLLPPLRWVNTEFRYYPIVLSAPLAAQKARLVSNGSSVNARANKPPMWYEQGVSIDFFVGEGGEAFGSNFTSLEEPQFLDGYLPVVSIKYRSKKLTYREEAFAPVDKSLAARGAALVGFSIDGDSSKTGRIAARVGAEGRVRVAKGEVFNGKGQSLLAFSPEWNWDEASRTLTAELRAGQRAELLVFTKPSESGARISRETYDEHRRQCIGEWKRLLTKGIRLTTPESIVNDAWRATLIGNFIIAVGDRPHYSAGNAYGKLYEGECGDTLRSLVLFGQAEVLRGMLKSMLEFQRKDTQFHVAGQKLQLLAYLYWITRDAEMVRALEPQWRQALELILNGREKESGLLPKDRYAGDIETKVYSLNSNANCWRGLRDMAALLDDIGEKDEAKRLLAVAAPYRQVILKAVERSERRDTKPPFIPVSLLSDEPAHDPLTATRTGSYYDLMCPYIIGSEIFGQRSEREDWLIGYLQQHGGIAMGMIRSQPHQGEFNKQPGVNPLYGLRYQLALLRRDDREKVLVGFYGQLAQAMTRDTFIGGEGSRFLHGDSNGRSFYLPPNSTSNAAWLITLRYLFVQDWDLSEDGEPDTLRLLYGVPRRWLADGQKIAIENAPSAFGPVSVSAESRLRDGQVAIRVTPPSRAVKTMRLRVPLPDGWRAESAEVDGKKVELQAGGVVDLNGTTKPVVVTVGVRADGT